MDEAVVEVVVVDNLVELMESSRARAWLVRSGGGEGDEGCNICRGKGGGSVASLSLSLLLS